MFGDPDLWASDAAAMPLIPGTVLPGLRTLIAGTPDALKLVPGRPVVYVTAYMLRAAQVQSAAYLISGTTAPLSSLSVFVMIDDASECGDCIMKWLRALSFCHDSLRRLTIQFQSTSTLHRKVLLLSPKFNYFH
ncbi:hypothetical protein FRC07_012643 [Ceratobasidium sp. 392]|nr:hypothetical protein FRC07_012643 [Ceratobasidium sp. 392]